MSDLALRLFDRWCAGFVDKNLENAMSVFANDAKLFAPGIQEISGKKALTEFFGRELPNIENYSISRLRTWEKGEETVIEWQNRYKDKRTGKSFQVGGVSIIELRGGLIQEMREYTNVPPL